MKYFSQFAVAMMLMAICVALAGCNVIPRDGDNNLQAVDDSQTESWGPPAAEPPLGAPSHP
jgi:hypothetical protein